MPDSQTLLCRVIPEKRPPKPPQRAVPTGPTVVESTGQKALVRTYQDLLKNPRDEALYEHHATVQLALVNTRSGSVNNLGAPGIFQSVEISPDGNHFLLECVKKPFSYLVPASGFPKSVEVWDRTGRVEFKLADVPLQTERPPGGVTPGPRRYHWRPTTPATLVWVEALDDGDPARRVAARDRVLMLRAPFTSEPVEIFRTQSRFSALSWAEVGYVALIRDYSNSKRWYRTYLFNPDNPLEEPVLLWNRSAQDRYGDPGTPLVRTLSTGQRAMRVHDNCLFLSGTGATPDGERPFLDRFNLTTLETTRIFECEPGHYETVVGFVQPDGSQFITRRESPTEPPNYMLREPRTGLRQALTKFPDPAPQLRQVTKQLLTYERADGVPLSGTLYLPPGYQPGTRLPTLIWAYPREYNDADTAGQVSGSTNRFTLFGGSSHLFFALQGYAVLDGAAMPVVGDPKKANDTYVEQIVANARAAVDALVERGVTDPDRVGVAGHSYGAFMTANLLAHSDIFRAGIARSGAYNRSLTPFGFQNESRTLWQAPDMYLKNSAFMAADKINEPLLLIHGEADENSGTFPMQSERMFQAVQGNGGLARLVLLPHETHSYEARESIEHVLWEMLGWFDRHVKNATPTNVTSGR
jgi:dipeptidyl aminopeptidase/acylaminoacyl peptidase